MEWTGFAKTSKARSLAIACEVASITPGELLQMDELERDLLVKSAGELERWRWSNWEKLLGG